MDDKSKKAIDRNFIALGEDYEVRYWTKTLSVSEEILRDAVENVGNGTNKVKAYLVEEGWMDEGFFDVE